MTLRQLDRTVHVSALARRLHLRTAAVCVVLVSVGCGLVVMALAIGDYPLTPSQVVGALTGRSEDRLATYFVQRMRLPRVVVALLVGACLGVAGAVFQSLTRNPLGSPDITGFTVGAATGAVLQIIVFGAGAAGVAAGAVVGGVVTGMIVFVLSGRSARDTTGFVLIGLGVSFFCQSINSLLLVRASLDEAHNAALWLAGSLHGVTWQTVTLLTVSAAAVAPVICWSARGLRVLELGDDLGAGLGVRVGSVKVGLVAAAVVLVAVSVAACGPIAFVALAAPQLARRLAHTPGMSLIGAGLMGAVLVLGADVVAQRLFAPVALPVGVVTGAVGGLYLIWLLITERRRRP